MILYYWWDHLLSSTVRGISVRAKDFFFSLKIYGKLAGLSNKFEPSMVFDPSEFEGTRFDLFICKMLISIFSWFFHTIFKDLTEQILYPKCNRMHHFASFWKNNFLGGGVAWQTLDPLPLLVSRGLACMWLCHQNLQKYTFFSQLNLKIYMKDLIVCTKFCKNDNFIPLWELNSRRATQKL